MRSLYSIIGIIFNLTEISLSRLKISALRRHGAVIEKGVFIAWGSNIGLGKNSKLKIGSSTRIDRYTDVLIGEGSFLEIGRNCYIGKRDIISANFGIKLGDNVICAHQVSILDSQHQMSDRRKPISEQGLVGGTIEIGNDVWIGVNCTILPNVKIGDHTVLGAHTLANGSYEGSRILVGTPARVLREL